MRPANLPPPIAFERARGLGDGWAGIDLQVIAAVPHPALAAAPLALPVLGRNFGAVRPAGTALRVAVGALRWPFAARPGSAGVTAPPPRAKTPRPLSGQPAPGKNPP